MARLAIALRQNSEAERSIAAAERSAALAGNHRNQAVLELLRAALNWNLGRVSAALEQAQAVLAAPEETAKSWKPHARVLLALGALRRADLGTAGAYVRQAAMDWALGNSHGPACAWMVVQTTAAEHGAEAAAPLVEQVISPGQDRERLLLADPAAAAWLARFMVRRDGRSAEAIAVTARTLSIRSGNLPALEAAARHAEGLVRRSAADLLFAADHHPDPWAAASAREDLGVLLAAQGASKQAITVLERAATGYLTAQSPRDVARLKHRLHRLGRSCDHADRPEESGSGILGLTKTETAVAELVALGLSNAQAAQKLFISRHTVAHHLRSIFKKLRISSRVELARTWMESSR
ncbi:response regulator transcription factor [Streptomyces lydicus]